MSHHSCSSDEDTPEERAAHRMVRIRRHSEDLMSKKKTELVDRLSRLTGGVREEAVNLDHLKLLPPPPPRYRQSNKRAIQGRKRGGWTPYGYKPSELDHGIMIVEPDQATIVKWIFKTFLSRRGGFGATAIARSLNDLNVKTKTVRAKWTRQSVGYILDNDTYAGWTRRKMPHGWRINTGLHDAIVPQKTFDAVKKVRHPERL